MPTTSRMPGPQRRAQLLQVATTQFGDRGYQRTSMEDIALAAGVTKPVLYQHFASKEDLYLAVIDQLGAAMVAGFETLLERHARTADRVEGGVRLFLEEFAGSGPAFQLIAQGENISPAVSERLGEVLDTTIDVLATILRRARVLTLEEARILGRGIAALAQSEIAQIQAAESEQQREQVVATLVTFITDGLRGFAPTAATAEDDRNGTEPSTHAAGLH
ncbi:MAG: TetR/AcrR family transcriptional regulator [Brachybacterium sp.]|nr:TetR/AcrR family transcriptional regulator [Brachybacterium sp.]